MPNDDENTTADERDSSKPAEDVKDAADKAGADKTNTDKPGADKADRARPTGKRKKSGGDGFDSVPDDFEPETDESRIPGKVTDAGKAKSSRKVSALTEKASQGKQVSFTLTPSLLLRCIAALLAIAVVVLLAIGTYGWFDERAKRDAGNHAVDSAKSFVVQLTNFSDINDYSSRMSPLVTGQHLKDVFSPKNSQDTAKQLGQMGVNASTSVYTAGVVSAGEKQSVVLVVSDTTGTSATAAQRTTERMIFQLTMDKHGDKWLVSAIDPVGQTIRGDDSTGGTPAPGDTSGAGTQPGAPADPNAPQTPAPAPTN
ncbi:hypothetical protein [Jongsikchunia kroppenstedtii]|uniref:hypothetical protein n=1 Tax=Jongsikchunia kroppenstedtii TaxID=1121721 RepID=UPI00038030FA|nr:hypothetical protein [Jongsikchunia kroppenstedtii]